MKIHTLTFKEQVWGTAQKFITELMVPYDELVLEFCEFSDDLTTIVPITKPTKIKGGSLGSLSIDNESLFEENLLPIKLEGAGLMHLKTGIDTFVEVNQLCNAKTEIGKLEVGGRAMIHAGVIDLLKVEMFSICRVFPRSSISTLDIYGTCAIACDVTHSVFLHTGGRLKLFYTDFDKSKIILDEGRSLAEYNGYLIG